MAFPHILKLKIPIAHQTCNSLYIKNRVNVHKEASFESNTTNFSRVLPLHLLSLSISHNHSAISMHRAGKFHLQREKLFQPFLTIPCALLFSMHFFSALCLFRSRWKLSSKLCNMNQSHSVEKVQWNYLCHCFLCVQRHKNGGHKD